MNRKGNCIWLMIMSMAVACSNDGGTNSAGEDTDRPGDDTETHPEAAGDVEIFSWWTSLGEADALQALMDTYIQAYPAVEIVNLSAVMGGGYEAWQETVERIAGDNPPDIFQTQPRNYAQWVHFNNDAKDNRIEPLDRLFEESGWLDKYPAEILRILAFDGKLYGVPAGIHRLNTLFYDKLLVPNPPKTLDEFFTLAASLANRGITPLAFDSKDPNATITILYPAVLAGSAGIQYYSDFFMGKIDLNDPASLAAFDKSIDDFLRVVSYTNPNAGELTWQESARLLYDGKAAMFIHGDWAKGYYTSLGWIPGADFDTAPAPGTTGLFDYALDIFSLCADAPNPENAMNFLRVVGSAEGQQPFCPLKGATPIHADVNTTDWDDLSRQTLSDFENAEIYNTPEDPRWATSAIPGLLLSLMDGTITKQILINNTKAGYHSSL